MKKISDKPKKLTKLEQEFVKGLIITGGSLIHAMAHTSYQGVNPSAQASNIWLRNHVKEAFKAGIAEKMARAQGVAVNSLIRLAEGAASEHVQLSASNSILDRTGLKEVQTLQLGSNVHVHLDLGLKASSDTGATQPNVHDSQVIDITPQNEGVYDDDVS